MLAYCNARPKRFFQCTPLPTLRAARSLYWDPVDTTFRGCRRENLMKTVLLVDDSRLMLVANQRLLTRAGYNVVTAPDGEKGLAATRRIFPDVVLLDMTLPTLSGIEVLRLLKGDMATAHI